MDGSVEIHSLASFLTDAIPRFLKITFCAFPEFMPARPQGLSLSASNPFTTSPRTTRSRDGSVVRVTSVQMGEPWYSLEIGKELRH
jgi:hypothetical protein